MRKSHKRKVADRRYKRLHRSISDAFAKNMSDYLDKQILNCFAAGTGTVWNKDTNVLTLDTLRDSIRHIHQPLDLPMLPMKFEPYFDTEALLTHRYFDFKIKGDSTWQIVNTHQNS